ncbi:ISL3 family transposase [Parafrankia sp. EAN1pec]|uniref:ISL3 family transposase n=1 Tax=Parafrankia sp. (strain EAN1pec) TaxID=298653 RepID=UPI00321B7F4B
MVDRVDRTGDRLRLWARVRGPGGACPGCGVVSERVHGRYRRRLVDAAIGGTHVEIDLLVRRFRCLDSGCSRVTFAEQVVGLTSPHARFTPLATGMIEAIGLALAGRAGSRLAGRVGLCAGRNTVLRRVRALPDPQVGVVATLGVDDFAVRRGRVYGTVLVDLDRHRPVDLLADREAATFAGWLAEHPGAQVICRDRAGAYADGARTGAPDAVEVADRWHLWHNLAGHVEATVARHRSCLKEPSLPAVEAVASQPSDVDEAVTEARDEHFESRAFVRNARERYAAVQDLKAQGLGIKPIMRELGLAKETVRKYYRAATIEDVLAKTRDGRGSVLRRWEPYLNERVNAGITNGSQLFREIREQGYPGSQATVLAYLRLLRTAGSTAPAASPAPKVRTVTRWVLTDPEHLDEEETLALKKVLTRCQHLQTLAGHVTAFAQMLTGRHGDRLNTWIAAVDADDLPELHRFTRGLLRDHDAVLNGLTLPHSSGQVEGTVNRIKMIKRQMYGRANFDLLRKRVLLAT